MTFSLYCPFLVFIIGGIWVFTRHSETTESRNFQNNRKHNFAEKICVYCMTLSAVVLPF